MTNTPPDDRRENMRAARMLLAGDGRPIDEMKELIAHVFSASPYWSDRITSLADLRDHYDDVLLSYRFMQIGHLIMAADMPKERSQALMRWWMMAAARLSPAMAHELADGLALLAAELEDRP
jgi:hypothetical protein